MEIGSVRVDIHETFVTGLGIGGKGSSVDFTPTDKKTVCAFVRAVLAVAFSCIQCLSPSHHLCVSRRCDSQTCMSPLAIVLQCVAVCCGVIQCVAVCCSVLQCVAVCWSLLQCVAVCCIVLHCVEECCSL